MSSMLQYADTAQEYEKTRICSAVMAWATGLEHGLGGLRPVAELHMCVLAPHDITMSARDIVVRAGLLWSAYSI